MKYGEIAFELVYLMYAFAMGVLILRRRHDVAGGFMGLATLILAGGDTFHLVPRMLNYFVEGDLTLWLGLGKLVTSLTMTLFYLLMYRLWVRVYRVREYPPLTRLVYGLVVLRVALCLLPQNGWLHNEGSVAWGIIRNVPFVLLGCLIVWLFYEKRDEVASLHRVWLLVALSFAFYLPVAIGASVVPMLGMLMLPKTVCYMLLIRDFWEYATSGSFS